MNEEVILISEADITPGKLDELKALMGKVMAFVKETEPDFLMYDWGVSEDGTKAFAIEHYANSKAVLFHVKNYAHFLEELDKLRTPVRGVVTGNPSEELLGLLKQMPHSEVYFYQTDKRL